MRFFFTTFFILFFILTAKAEINKNYKFVIAININSCTFCNRSITSFVTDQNYFNDITFLLSDDDVTLDQAKSFLYDLLGKPCKIITNPVLFNKISAQIDFFKMPHFIVLDSINNIVFKTSIDSINFYTDVIQLFNVNKITKNTYSNNRLSNIIGLKTINKINDYILVTGWQSTQKIYIYNFKTKSIDSLYLYNKDSIIKSLLTINGNGNLVFQN